MKKFLFTAATIIFAALTFNSCTVVDGVPDDDVIITLGTPYYSSPGVILYYDYGGYHYYPRYYRGTMTYYRYAPHHRPHRYEHAGRPHVWREARPTRPRPSGGGVRPSHNHSTPPAGQHHGSGGGRRH